MARKHSSGTPATLLLAKHRVPHTLHPYDHDPDNTHFGDEAATALGFSTWQVFKTLVVSCQGAKDPLAVAVVPVATQLDLKAMAHAVGAKKVALAEPSEAEKVTGYVVGGISPLGQKRPLPTVVDDTALTYATIMVSAGRRGLQVELGPDDLVRLTAARLAPIGR